MDEMMKKESMHVRPDPNASGWRKLVVALLTGWAVCCASVAYAAPSAAACEAAFTKAKAESAKTYEAEFAQIGKRAADDPRIFELQHNLADLRGTGRHTLIKSLQDELKTRIHPFDVEKGRALQRAIARNNQAKKAYDTCIGRPQKKPVGSHKQPKKQQHNAAAGASGGGSGSGAAVPRAEDFVEPKVAEACKPLAHRLTGLRFELASIRYEKKTLGNQAEGIRDESLVKGKIRLLKKKLDVCVKRSQKKQSGGGSGSGSGAAGSSGGGSGSGSGARSSGTVPIMETVNQSSYSRTIHAPQQTVRLVVDEDMAFPATFQFTGWACGGGVVSFFSQAKAFIASIGDKSLDTLETMGDSNHFGDDPFHTAMTFMRANGTPAQFDINPEMTVPAPGRKAIKNCYTKQEVTAMLKQVDGAVTVAIARKKRRF